MNNPLAEFKFWLEWLLFHVFMSFITVRSEDSFEMIYFKSFLLYDPLKLKMTNKNCSSFGHFPNGKLRFLYELKKNTEALIRKAMERLDSEQRWDK